MPLRLNAGDPDFDGEFSAFLDRRRGSEESVAAAVSGIISDIRSRGDRALLEYTRKFDRSEIASSEELRISADEIEHARKGCDPEVVTALDLAAGRIRDFHERQLPRDFEYTDEVGVRLGARWTPVESAGIYVPGGTAAYPSSVLMNAIPASVAEVPRIVMTVPAPDDRVNPLVLAAADIAGIKEIYRVGGAQAVAALACGTDMIDPVDKIVGPGNTWVAESKRQVFGIVGIDMIAGPSEILVVADGESDPDWVAADLMSQAEHDTAAQPILITDDEQFANAVEEAMVVQAATLPRAAIAQASWRDNGAVIIVESLEAAIPLIDRIAPEHLELSIAEPDGLAARVRNAGAIFLGRYTPEAIGDYVAGPNHVLPTSRTARFASGLAVTDFMKRTTLVGCSPDSLARIGPAAVTLAKAEGLTAHADSVAFRLGGD